MKDPVCQNCKALVEEWNKKCGACGVHLVMEPAEAVRARYLRGPSLGALLWTQGWAFGARLYVWFLLSLVPIAGIVALVVLVLFGRRWSWKRGGWASWEEFQDRMRLLDAIGVCWIATLVIIYFIARE
ncbi:hypothetical protein HYW18_02685 [Candidatus Uhrbacteria bacterium]|nr:hypothetical protein [Candidatus Uhrbacteria bacterium]